MEHSLKLKHFFSDYKENVKEFSLEEPIDFFIFRPIAFVLLKFTINWPLRPNHFSILALLSALIAAFYLSLGNSVGLICGGFWIISFCIFDCCDGMLARMKKNGSKYGDLIDMFVDLLSNMAFFIGIFIGLNKYGETSAYKYLIWIGGISILLHACIYQFYKDQFFNYFQNNPDGRRKKIEQLKRDYGLYRNEKRNYFDRILIRMFLLLNGAQRSKKSSKKYHALKYVECNKNILPLWGLIAGSSHLFVLSMALIFQKLASILFFPY